MDIDDISKEAFIQWNGPPMQRPIGLGEKHFTEQLERGGNTYLITLDNKLGSVVTKRLKTEEPDLPFF